MAFERARWLVFAPLAAHGGGARFPLLSDVAVRGARRSHPSARLKEGDETLQSLARAAPLGPEAERRVSLPDRPVPANTLDKLRYLVLEVAHPTTTARVASSWSGWNAHRLVNGAKLG